MALLLAVFWLTALIGQTLSVRVGPANTPRTVDQPPLGDQRRPVDEFTLPSATDQVAVRGRLAATQSLTCDPAAASLVYRPDVIIFAAHEILRKNGALQAAFSDCAFRVSQTRADGHTHVDIYPIVPATLDYGPLVEEGADDGDRWLQSNVDDWAVARLARPVEGIEPYPLVAQHDIERLKAIETPLVEVSPPTENWHGKESYLAQSCRSLTLYSDTNAHYPALLFSDCFSGFGASGGATLVADGHGGLQYLATVVATDRDCARGGSTTCVTTSRRLDADLVARIKGTTGRLDGAEDAPLRVAQTQRLAAARAAATEAIARQLDAPMKATDAASRVASRYYAQMQQAFVERRYDAIAPLANKAIEAFGDIASVWNRPEMAQVERLKGDGLRALNRLQDARAAYSLAYYEADPALSGYIALRLGETADTPQNRHKHLVEAYSIGGRTLFERFGDETEIPGLGG